MTWTTELAAAEAAEASYRSARKGSLPNSYRLDGRGAVLLTNWIQARAAVSSAAPAANQSFWANCAVRAVVAMGPAWSIVTSQLQPLSAERIITADEMRTHQPFGSAGSLDGLFGGLLSQWSTDVWTTSGRTVPTAAFPPQEVWTYLFGNSIAIAGAS